jgi:beta-glucanase (GH16 family)
MEIEFNGYKWITQQPWGDYHPSFPDWWYDPSCVEVTDNILRLQTKRHERKTDSHINKIGAGLVTSVDTFGYGVFEAEVMLPMGTGLFPAFWLWGSKSWPPEIDIFEGWSRKNGLYTSKWIPYYSLASNVHYNISPNNQSIKSKSHMIWKRFDREFINFKLIWTSEEISIYYNSKLVRQVTDSNILKWFQDNKMWVLFNNGIDKIQEYKNDSVMLIKNFKYTKI